MRVDQRNDDELRTCTIEPHFITQALGSVLITAGRTRVICTASLEARAPSWLQKGGWVTAEYAMLPGATQPRGRRDPGGRGKEIQRLIGRSLRAAVDLEQLVDRDGTPLSFVCDCDVIEADGGTRTASITGGYVALCLALAKLRADGVLRRDVNPRPIAAISVGLVPSNPEPRAVLDLCYIEDSQAQVDLNVIMGRSGDLIEVQGTAERGAFSRQQLNAMLDLAEKGIGELLQLQARTLEGLR